MRASEIASATAERLRRPSQRDSSPCLLTRKNQPMSRLLPVSGTAQATVRSQAFSTRRSRPGLLEPPQLEQVFGMPEVFGHTESGGV
jgi:hypothetical protein